MSYNSYGVLIRNWG